MLATIELVMKHLKFITTKGHSGHDRDIVRSAMKRFSGNESVRQPFLIYLIWLKNLSDHIADYEVKYRANLLMSYIHKEVTNKIIGYENNYEEAMAELDHYFGDKRK